MKPSHDINGLDIKNFTQVYTANMSGVGIAAHRMSTTTPIADSEQCAVECLALSGFGQVWGRWDFCRGQTGDDTNGLPCDVGIGIFALVAE